MDSLIYTKKGSRVQCRVCSHYCVLDTGDKGACRIRQNRDGSLVVLTGKKVIAQSVDPIEKKPIYHLKPGSTSYSIAGIGCNFQCTFCQNAQIAQELPGIGAYDQGTELEPGEIVQQALSAGCQSISYTYTEPTVFLELALQTARLAKEKGLHNIFVTNGFMSGESLDLLLPVLSAANVDLKAFNEAFYKKYCRARLAPVKRSIEKMKDAGVHVELTTLLIPGLNDGEEDLTKMAAYIAGRLGPDTPWHISRFHPCYRMTDRGATPVEALETAHGIGKKAGLRYVYIGNLPGGKFEHTHCHYCDAVLIRRHGYQVTSFLKDDAACPGCGTICAGLF